MNIKRLTVSIADKTAYENAVAQAIVNAANIDYIAMMADIEIPTEEEGVPTAGFSSYDGEFRMPLVLAQASPIFHSSCEGKLGIALE